MKKILFALTVAPFIIFPGFSVASTKACPAKPAVVMLGFSTGIDAINESDAWLRAYVMGYVNAITVSGILGVSEPCVREATSCFLDRSDQQLAAMLRKFLNDNPSRWHESLNTLTYAALLTPCLNK